MNKKLKTLCLGALLTTSVFGFTGCDLLSSKTNETVANNQLSLEEARALLALSFYKLNVNKDGVLNNLVMNVSHEEDSRNTYVYVDSNNNTYVFETKISSTGVEELVGAVYDTADKETMEFYTSIITTNGETKTKYVLKKSEDYKNALASFLPMMQDFENVIVSSVDTLENGNYSIVYLETSEYSNEIVISVFAAEITKDAKIISLEFDECDYDYDYDGNDRSYVEIENEKATFKYNEMTQTKFQEFMTYINNHKNTTN